jgi:hypothetical protein
LVLLAFGLGVVIASGFACVLLSCTGDVLSGIFGLIDDSHWVYPFFGGHRELRMTVQRPRVGVALNSHRLKPVREIVLFPRAARNAGNVGLKLPRLPEIAW